MLFVNKLKVLTLMTCLVLVGQGFGMDAWVDHKSASAPTTNDAGCYMIGSAAELAWYANFVNGQAEFAESCAKLTANINLSGNFWVPISYKGTRHLIDFDGQGYVIRNMYIGADELLSKYGSSSKPAQNLGLFGAFAGHIQNVILEDVQVFGYGTNKDYTSTNADIIKGPISIGTLVGWETTLQKQADVSVVENCYVTGQMVTRGAGQAVGGIVGNNGGGIIRNCFSAVNVDASGVAYVGGIVGYTKKYVNKDTKTSSVTISSCVYAGETLSSNDSGEINGKTYTSQAGAIVGNHYEGETNFENVYYDSEKFDKGVGETMDGTTNGTTSGTNALNSELIACTLNGGVIGDDGCTVNSPWSTEPSGLSLNGYGADGYKITFDANGGAFADGSTKFVKYVQPDYFINNDGVDNPSWDEYHAFAKWSSVDDQNNIEAYMQPAGAATIIKAVWNPVYTITFSPVNGTLNGTFPDGSSMPKTVKVEQGKKITVQGFDRPTSFTQDGVKYNFVGWANAVNPDPDNIENYDSNNPKYAYVKNGLDDLPEATDNMTMVAVWTTADVWTVSFFANDISMASYVSSVYDNDKATAWTAERTGYTFKGWFENTSCAGESTEESCESFDFGQEIVRNVDLYARWSKNSYSISYDLNGSDGENQNQNFYYPADGLELNAVSWNDAHEFNGWYLLNDQGQKNNLGTTIPVGTTGDLTLYADWTEISYAVIYSAGFGASGNNIQPAKKLKGEDLLLINEVKFTRTGYTQNGWVSKENSDEVYLFPDPVYTIDNKITLIPHWEPNVYKITYKIDGKNVTLTPNTYTVESGELASPSRDGYTFDGWHARSDYSDDAFSVVPNGTTGNKTFYGKWDLVTYTVTYNLNGGALPEDAPIPHTYTIESGVTLLVPSKENYEFAGWYNNAEFEGDAITEIGTGATGDTAIYAKWTPESYVISYELNGGVNAAANPDHYSFGDVIDLEDPTKEGYHFDGWFVDDEFNGDAVAGIAASTTGDAKFYAKWTAEEYTATYDLAGGSMDGDESFTFTIESEAIQLATPTKNGYAFDGWLDGVTGEVVTVLPTGSFGNRTLTAQWTPIEYTITYKIDNESAELTPSGFTVENDVTLAAPTRDGYTFDGWYLDDGMTGEKVTGFDAGEYTDNQTFYGKWIRTYTITYEGADGLENLNPTSYTVLEDDLVLQPVSKPGSKFLGWFDDDNTLVTSIEAGTVGNINLTAKWAEFPVLVTTYGGIEIFENEDKTKTAVIDGKSEKTVAIPTADNVSVNQVVFNRDFSEGKRSTVMFPFTVSLNDVSGGEFWEFMALEYSSETGWLFRIMEPEDNELKANKPYIFIADEETKNIEFNLSGSVSLSTDVMNPSIHNGWAFKGVYEHVVFNENHPEWAYAYGYSDQTKRNVTKGSFVRFKTIGFDEIDLVPMRAYLVYDKSLAKSIKMTESANVGELPEFIDVEIVGKKGLAIGGGVLNTTTGELKMDRWYDLRGRKLNGKPTTQGTYYYNGKRIIVR